MSYTDNIIIFVKEDSLTLKLLMKTQTDYEEQSRKKINKEKSTFYVYHKAAHKDILKIEDHTGFHKGKFPLTYQGCPVGYAKKKVSFHRAH